MLNARACFTRGLIDRPARFAAALLLGVALLPPAGAAAQRAEPFSRIELSAVGTARLNRDGLDEYWRTLPGGLVRAATPFYLGSVALAVQAIPFEPVPGVYDLDALTVALEWNGEARLWRGTRASAGVQVGNATFKFHEQETRIFLQEESEFLAGVQAAVRTRVTHNVGVLVTARHQRIFTHIPVRLTFAGAGVEYAFGTPRWLRGFLE